VSALTEATATGLGKALALLERQGINQMTFRALTRTEPWELDASLHDEMPSRCQRLLLAALRLYNELNDSGASAPEENHLDY
jgi:hypothetical protein